MDGIRIERRVFMPNGRRTSDGYNREWCDERHDKIDNALESITGRYGHLERLHNRINYIWYLLVGVGVVGVANLIATLSGKV